ncbi:MAG: transcription termination factor Rho [Clostridium sp.]
MTKEVYKEMTLAKLKEIAKELEIKNISKFKKDELIEEILKIKSKNEEATTNKQGVVLREKIAPKQREARQYNNYTNNNNNISNSQSNNYSNNSNNNYSNNNTNNNNNNTNNNNNNNRTNDNFSSDVQTVSGILEIQENNSFGFLRGENYLSSSSDVYVSPAQIRRFNLSTGDMLVGKAREAKEGEKFKALIYVDKVNDESPERAIRRTRFEKLTPIYPTERIRLEGKIGDLSTRLMDIICPIGKGQRGIIVAPPKAGKTTLLKTVAQNISENAPNVKIIVLLIDERPEEVTDMQRSIKGEVIYSTFDEEPQNHAKVAQMVLERGKRMVEQGQDVIILLDSLTRLSRAYNLTITPTGRTLSGGLDPGALIMPKKFFGAARNIEEGGSLTILATALVDTGSRMDDMIFEEFKGTGNMEVHLDRRLQERRIFPAIDIYKSGTRKEDLLLTTEEREVSYNIRKTMYADGNGDNVTENLLKMLSKTKNNNEFVQVFSKIGK